MFGSSSPELVLQSLSIYHQQQPAYPILFVQLRSTGLLSSRTAADSSCAKTITVEKKQTTRTYTQGVKVDSNNVSNERQRPMLCV